MTAEAEHMRSMVATWEEVEGFGTKLAMWYTRNFKPLITHKDLEPIMSPLGFVPLPLFPTTTNIDNIAVNWKGFEYCGASAITTRTGAFLSRPYHTNETQHPTPRLPYPRIDGLHLFTYTAFIEAVNFYLMRCNSDDIFHIRGMPLQPVPDQNRKWEFMIKDNCKMVNRPGTLDNALFDQYSMDIANCAAVKRFQAENDYFVADIPKVTVVSMDDIIIH